MKKISLILIALLTVFLLTACGTEETAAGADAESDTLTETPAEETESTETVPESAAESEETEPAETMTAETMTAETMTAAPFLVQGYEEILDRYVSAVNDRTEMSELSDLGVCQMVGYMYDDHPLDVIGYNRIDLDGNGVEELIIGIVPTYANEFLSHMFLAVFTMNESGETVEVFESGERDRYYFAGQNKLAHVGSSGVDDSLDTTVLYENGALSDQEYATDPANYVFLALTSLAQYEANK